MIHRSVTPELVAFLVDELGRIAPELDISREELHRQLDEALERYEP